MLKQTFFNLSLFVIFSSSNFWTGPIDCPSLTITPEPGDVIAARAGDEVEYTCSFMEHPGYAYTVTWFQTKGNIDYEMVFENNQAVTLKMQLTVADDDSYLVCKVFSSSTKGYTPFLNSKATKVLILSSGDRSRNETTPPVERTLTITPAPGDVKSEHSEGEEIEFTCRARTEDMSGPNLYWEQVRGNLETTRTFTEKNSTTTATESILKIKLTKADDNTKLYCYIWSWSSIQFNYMFVRSDYITVHIIS